MITSVSLRNFKSWKTIEDMRLAPISGLFGTNSSGKTSILQWLLMMKQTVDSSDRMQVLNLGDEKTFVQLGTFRDIVFAHDTDAWVECGIHWTLDRDLEVADPERKRAKLFTGRNLSFKCTLGIVGNQLLVEAMEYGFADHNFSYSPNQKGGKKSGYRLEVDGSSDFRFRRTQGRAWDLPAPVKCYGFPDQVNSYFQNAGFLTDLQLSFEELFNHVYYLGPLREYPKRQYTWGGAQPADMGQRGEKVVDAILSSRARGESISRGKGRPRYTVEEYAAYWLKELELIADFQVEPVAKNSNIYQVLVKKGEHSVPVSVTDVGFGISQILPVIAICYYVPEGSTVILEQPEIHLHPKVQAGLADVFIDAIGVRGIQLIIESHSEHLLRRLQRRIAEQKLDPSEVALYFCDSDGIQSRLDELKVNLFGNIANWPKDFFGDELGEMAAMTKAGLQRRRGGAA